MVMFMFMGNMGFRISSIVLCILLISCERKTLSEVSSSSYSKEIDYIRPIEGKDEVQNPDLVKLGKVLISYNDCGDCHTENKRAKGPSFTDVAKRYPANEAFIGLLSRKIISGGFGSWGNPVMSAHPKLPAKDAEAMVIYILSLD